MKPLLSCVSLTLALFSIIVSGVYAARPWEEVGEGRQSTGVFKLTERANFDTSSLQAIGAGMDALARTLYTDACNSLGSAKVNPQYTIVAALYDYESQMVYAATIPNGPYFATFTTRYTAARAITPTLLQFTRAHAEQHAYYWAHAAGATLRPGSYVAAYGMEGGREWTMPCSDCRPWLNKMKINCHRHIDFVPGATIGQPPAGPATGPPPNQGSVPLPIEGPRTPSPRRRRPSQASQDSPTDRLSVVPDTPQVLNPPGGVPDTVIPETPLGQPNVLVPNTPIQYPQRRPYESSSGSSNDPRPPPRRPRVDTVGLPSDPISDSSPSPNSPSRTYSFANRGGRNTRRWLTQEMDMDDLLDAMLEIRTDSGGGPFDGQATGQKQLPGSSSQPYGVNPSTGEVRLPPSPRLKPATNHPEGLQDPAGSESLDLMTDRTAELSLNERKRKRPSSDSGSDMPMTDAPLTPPPLDGNAPVTPENQIRRPPSSPPRMFKKLRNSKSLPSLRRPSQSLDAASELAPATPPGLTHGQLDLNAPVTPPRNGRGQSSSLTPPPAPRTARTADFLGINGPSPAGNQRRSLTVDMDMDDLLDAMLEIREEMELSQQLRRREFL